MAAMTVILSATLKIASETAVLNMFQAGRGEKVQENLAMSSPRLKKGSLTRIVKDCSYSSKMAGGG